MKKFLWYTVLSLLLIEIGGHALALIHLEPTGFKLFLNNSWKNDKNAYADMDTLVGVWHQPNDSWVKSGPCFTVEMHSNQYGATDNRWDTAQKGYLFLGNSFIEGYGVSYGQRVSEYFEALTHTEVFNCGMSGTFSPVQYFMTLRKFESTLPFDTCFVFLTLPEDEKLITRISPGRYQPYLNDTGIVYTRSQKLFPENKSLKNKITLAIQQFSYTYHLYDFFNERNQLKSALLTKLPRGQEHFTNLQRIVQMFCDRYPDKYFYFVLTPNLSSVHEPFLVEKQKNMEVIDLRNCLDKRTDYLICNPHWNNLGHAKLANCLFQKINQPAAP